MQTMVVTTKRVRNLKAIALSIFLLIQFHSKAQKNNIVVKDDFSSKPFGVIVTERNVKSIIKQPTKRSSKVANKTDGVEGDSIISLSSSGNYFYFLKSKNKSVFFGAKIVTSNVKFANGIFVGMTKSAFFKKFGMASVKSDTIIISDSNEMCHHNFFFKNSKLTDARIDGCID